MKIVRVVSELDFGGVEQVLANSVPILSAQEGIQVSIIVLGKGGRVSELLTQQGIDVKIFNQNPRIPNFRLLYQLYQLLKSMQPDVIHCQGAEANFHGIMAGHWAGVSKIIGEEIGIPSHHSYWKYIFKWVYSKANLVIAISEAVKNVIVELGEVEAEKVKVLYNPVELGKKSVDLSISESVPNNKGEVLGNIKMLGNRENENAFVFITTCRLVPIKNLDKLILAFSELIKENGEMTLELSIVGDGPLKDDLIQQVKTLGLGNKVKFWGFHENVIPFLERADVFVLPSLKEGSSVSLAEAMACGLPAVVTKIGGAREILGNSNSGYLIDPLDQIDLKQAMQNMVNLSPEERKEMGQMATLEAQRFSVERYLDTLLKLYDSKS